MSDRLTDVAVQALSDLSASAHVRALAREVQETRPELVRLRAEVARLTAERDRLIDAINTPAPTRADTEGNDG